MMMISQSFYNKYRPKNFSDIKGSKSAEILNEQIKITKPVTLISLLVLLVLVKPPLLVLLPLILLGNDSVQTDLVINDNHPDVYEINCAVNNGVDHIRENVVQLSRLAPTSGKYKIFILDEAQMLTTQAQTSLIKLVEEPPHYVKFFFCTTDPHKILRALHTRCQTFLMKKMSQANLVSLLSDVCDKEDLTYEESALSIIAEDSEGSPRTALSILEQVSVSEITEENVREILDRSPKHLSYDLCNAIIDKDYSQALRIIQSAHLEGRNLNNLIIESSSNFLTAFKYIALSTKRKIVYLR